MARFSETTITALKKAGWYEGRRRVASFDIALLTRKGYPLFPCVVAFLEEFGDLRIPYVRKLAGGYLREYLLRLDIPGKIDDVPPDSVAEWGLGLGRPLCFIGAADEWYTTVVMDDTGAVYELRDDGLYLAGKSGEEAIETFESDVPRVYTGVLPQESQGQ